MKKLYLKGLVQKDVNGELTVIVSDESVDRAGDSIPVASWDLKNFLTAPRMFVDHDYSVKSLTGVWKNPRIEDGKLKMTPVFHNITELARVNKEMVDQGFLNTTSVGYIPHKMKDGRQVNELLEVSWVGVPCNANARVEMSIKDLNGSETDAVKEFLKGEGIEEVEAKEAMAGDACTMDDGTEGVMTDDGNGGFSCQLKPAEEAKKGLVDDINAANQELREAKWPMMCAVWDAFNDFWLAWMSDAVAADQFAPMLADLSATILALQSGTIPLDEADDEDTLFLAIQGMTTKMLAFRGAEQKAGRELSQGNRDIIKQAIDSIESGTTALKDLHAATDGSVVEDAATGKGEGERSKTAAKFGGKDELKEFILRRQIMQVVSTVTAGTLAEMRKKLSN